MSVHFAIKMQFLLLRVKITKAIHRCLLGQHKAGYGTVKFYIYGVYCYIYGVYY
jgi:hypothetical protein